MAAKVTGLARVMLAMATNEAGKEVFVAEPREKAAVVRLEKMGLVTVRKTEERCAGYRVYFFTLAPVRENVKGAPWE